MFALALLTSIMLVSSALAADHKIAVGSGGLNFDPSSVSADVGDTVTFSFPSSTHMATLSTFANPCVANSVSAFNAKGPGDVVFDVTSTNASWFFCATQGHCQGGMVFAVNPAPEGQEKSYSAFKAAAEGKPHDHTSGDNHTSTASGSSTSATASTAAGSSDGDPVVMPFTSKGLFFAGLLGGLGAVFLGL